MKRYRSIFIELVVAAAMITGIRHDYLWGPDEPRVAEITRETLVDGHWVTPHLCGLPFLEKPPLYFDLIALAYGISGRITPAVARTVSFFFGCLMLVAVWLFGRSWRGSRTAWLMVLALATMPRFWRYSHWIIIDIGIGALTASALACFARAELFSREKQNNREKVYVIIMPRIYEALLRDPAINRFLQSMKIQPITGPEVSTCLLLVSSRTS